MTRCRSCGASVLWTVTEATGSMMPIDAMPADNGNVVLPGGHRRTRKGALLPLSRTLGPLEAHAAREDEQPLYLSHFVTCLHPPERKHR
jgi:hypothetical protein